MQTFPDRTLPIFQPSRRLWTRSLPKGIDAAMSADVRISACLGDMPKEVLIKVWNTTNDGHKTTYYLCPVGLDKDGNVEFGDAEEVDVSAQFMNL